jgi:hypothetical protein
VHNPHGSIIGAVETFEELQHAANPDHREPKPKLPGCIDNVTGVASQLLMRSHLRHTLATFVELQVPFGVLLPVPRGTDAVPFRLRIGGSIFAITSSGALFGKRSVDHGLRGPLER